MDAALAAWFGGLPILFKFGVAFLLIAAFFGFFFLMDYIKQSLEYELFDGDGIELRKVIPFVLWMVVAPIVFVYKFVAVLFIINGVKNEAKSWRN